MSAILTREFVADILSQSILDHRSRALYDLCYLHRDHLRDVIVADKLRLIARLFAEYEMGQGFSPERGAHCLAKSPVDHWFATVATAEELDGWLPLELHKRVMDVFADLPEGEARSLASKYLHFHFPELFFIHDSLVERAARKLVGEECGYLAMSEHDPAYGQFHACCRRLGERLARDLGRRLSPRELDRVLRAWLDMDGARQRDGVGCADSRYPPRPFIFPLRFLSLSAVNEPLRLELRTSPHVVKNNSVERIMFHVVLALLPIAVFSVWQYGLSALALLVTVTATCLLSERLFNRLNGTASTLSDWSATITGLLLALTLPPAFPLWMGAVAGFTAIALGKALFGGIGYNVLNPALVGRAFVQAAFPVAITTWIPAFSTNRFSEFAPTTFTTPFMTPPDIGDWARAAVDGFTGATPLARWKFENVLATPGDFLSGAVTASAGETSAILILVCGAYLAIRKFMDWRIPVAVLGSAALTAWVFQMIDPSRYPDPLFVLLSGGLMIGAVFMATDMATSPVTPRGVWIYGALIGVVTVMIRYFGGLTEGVMYAILIGNALAPLIDQVTQPRVFGAGKGKKA